MGIEFLTHEKIDEACDFAEISHADSAWKDYPFERHVLGVNLARMVGNHNYFTCIYRKNGKIVGYFFATLGAFLFSSKMLGMENGIYIAPEHRGGRVALLMYNEFLGWCEQMKVEPMIEIYFGSDAGNSKVYEFFTKVGMIECGRVFRGGINGLR